MGKCYLSCLTFLGDTDPARVDAGGRAEVEGAGDFDEGEEIPLVTG